MNNLFPFPFPFPCRSLLLFTSHHVPPREKEKKKKKAAIFLHITNPSLISFFGGSPPPPREKKKKKKVHRGRASTELHLHCYQLILWKQCYALIHTIGLPPELESVIKDLWALRLQLLKGRLSDPEKDGELLFTSKPEMEKSEVGIKKKKNKKKKKKRNGGQHE